MASRVGQLLETTTVEEATLEHFAPPRVDVAVHDATRLGWNVVVPLPERGRAKYTFELELEVPANLLSTWDPWGALQSYARLAGSGEPGAPMSPDAFRRDVVEVSGRLARARDGFVRHCTLIRTSSATEENHRHALFVWISAACAELARARAGLLRERRPGEADTERGLADEYLSVQLWAALTDCARALLDTQRSLAGRSAQEAALLDGVEKALAAALEEEIAYRRAAEFTLAEPVNALQLERLLSKLRLLKKHFERVLFLEGESYQVVNRLAGWFSALAAMLAYLWFFFWQVTLERHPAAIGSGVVAFALLTAVAYASRERLKEAGRNWLAGRIQRMFAQRVTRCRLPSSGRQRGAVVVSARESFSQSAAQRADPLHPEGGPTHDVTVLRFVHRGAVVRPIALESRFAREVRFAYRLDLSPLFPRLHDAVRGFASPDERTGRIAIVDVPRNYELPLRARLHWDGEQEAVTRLLVLNKNGLLRVEDAVGLTQP